MGVEGTLCLVVGQTCGTAELLELLAEVQNILRRFGTAGGFGCDGAQLVVGNRHFHHADDEEDEHDEEHACHEVGIAQRNEPLSARRAMLAEIFECNGHSVDGIEKRLLEVGGRALRVDVLLPERVHLLLEVGIALALHAGIIRLPAV